MDAIEIFNEEQAGLQNGLVAHVTVDSTAAELDYRPISGLTGREMLLVRSAVRKRDQNLTDIITDEERQACRKFASRRLGL